MKNLEVEEALKSPLEWFKNQVAKPLAQKISQIAQRLGYKKVENWAEDEDFIRHLP